MGLGPSILKLGHVSASPRASLLAICPLLQALQKKVLVVSVAEITFDRSVYSQLPGQEAFLRAQVVTVWWAVARLLRGLLRLNL